MIDAIVEISVNIFQSFMYIGFLFLLFNKEKKTKKDYIGFFSFVAILFIALTYFSFNPIHFTNLDEIIYTCIQIVYAVFLLREYICKNNYANYISNDKYCNKLWLCFHYKLLYT